MAGGRASVPASGRPRIRDVKLVSTRLRGAGVRAPLVQVLDGYTTERLSMAGDLHGVYHKSLSLMTP